MTEWIKKGREKEKKGKRVGGRGGAGEKNERKRKGTNRSSNKKQQQKKGNALGMSSASCRLGCVMSAWHQRS